MKEWSFAPDLIDHLRKARKVVVLTGAGVSAESGAYVIEINPQATPISSRVHITLQAESGKILPALWREVQHRVQF